jgi:hypothetical protein
VTPDENPYYANLPEKCFNAAMNLYPPPKKYRGGRAKLALRDRTIVKLLNAIEPRLAQAVERLAARHGLTMTYGDPDAGNVLVTIEKVRQLDATYTLNCSQSGILLQAKTDEGIFYGLTTLDQVLMQAGNDLATFTIEDTEDFANRGVMLDVSRCKVPTMETLKVLIDELSSLKYNQLQLYIEHTFAFTNHQTVWADASPFTAAEILELDTYCHDRFIELVPNLNSFGHFERWLRHPEYHRYAECPDGFTHPISGQHTPFGSTLKPDAQSLGLLRELYAEFLPLFRSSQFNIGGDEPWELGQGRSRSRCERSGTTQVYLDFLSKIQKLASRHDRRIMFWSYIVLKDPTSLKSLSGDQVAMNWGYEGNHPFRKENRQMSAARVPYYVCPGTSSWNTLTGRIDNATRNLGGAARAGLAEGAVGYLVTDWGDHGHHQYLPISYPGFLLGACNAWNHRGSRDIDVADGINRIFLDDKEPTLARSIIKLGQVLELAPSEIRNATIFNRLLFWRMQHEPETVRKIRNSQLAACARRFDRIEAEIGGPTNSEAGIVIRDELFNAIRLANHGIDRLHLFRGETRDVDSMRSALRIAIGEHERLWLARNRPGGLHESSDRLRESFTML